LNALGASVAGLIVGAPIVAVLHQFHKRRAAAAH
jgi:hypothetical protein